jgi:hypothetical protein
MGFFDCLIAELGSGQMPSPVTIEMAGPGHRHR